MRVQGDDALVHAIEANNQVESVRRDRVHLSRASPRIMYKEMFEKRPHLARQATDFERGAAPSASTLSSRALVTIPGHLTTYRYDP